ncbi:hypothetical protein VNI00_005124 [Paramarasmius palmivorus]|uniref:Transcription factor TFIIIC complex subunit Tfc6 n=1 Tax=Paramarasmius palmivorus TaxID=297713 RepID=A0AAW0DLC6_9AGAR
MSRQLRPRRSRPSYTPTLFDDNEDHNDVIEGSQRDDENSDKNGVVDGGLDDQSSGSDFDPEKEREKRKKRGKFTKGDDEGSNPDSDELFEEDEELEERPKKKGKGKATIPKKPQKKSAVVTISAGNTLTPSANASQPVSQQQTPSNAHQSLTATPSIARRNFGKLYSLPTPSVSHRHRAVPLFTLPNSRTSRLTEPPKLFEEGATTGTNSFTSSAKVIDKISKAWGYNVGSGPLWELVEDRGWFKESGTAQEEKQKRPRVHENVGVKSGWRILTLEQATHYLPTDVTATESGQLKPPSPVACSFGPYGKQTKVEVPMFGGFAMAQYIPESKAHIFNAGAQVWAMDWCPLYAEDRQVDPTQYLAVAPFPSASHFPEVGRPKRTASPGCIQIWSLSPTKARRSPKGKGKASEGATGPEGGEDTGKMTCEMVLCFDLGPIHAMQWVPLPTNSPFSNRAKTTPQPTKLGLLSATFEDGSFAIYAVPDPVELRSRASNETEGPLFVHLPAPILRVDTEEDSCFWSLDWANSELIAIGTTSGTILVYNLKSALQNATDPDLPTLTRATHPHLFLPTHCITAHQSAIRALAWVRAPSDSHIVQDRAQRTDFEDDDGTEDGFREDPTVIATGGYDGMECMTDIREGKGVVMNRTRDVINALTYSTYVGGPITIDHENIVKAYSASPKMLGRGHLLLEPQGPVWSLSASDYHPQLAVGSADGSCLTTNMLRSARRSNSVPFFVHKVYQMDYSRNLKEYRMLDRFLPQETQEKPTAGLEKAKAKKKPNGPNGNGQAHTGAWPREVGIHVVRWNSSNGPANAGLLASGTASGLCRVDWIWGRWMKGRIPYHGIPSIRGEEEGSSTDSVDSG